MVICNYQGVYLSSRAFLQKNRVIYRILGEYLIKLVTQVKLKFFLSSEYGKNVFRRARSRALESFCIMLEGQMDQEQTQITQCKNTAVNNWLAERSQVIVLFCKLSGYRNQTKLPEDDQINLFCDILIDYVSAGHFEVYEQIVNDCEINGPTSIELLKDLYPRISKTTDIVVDFNEKYSDGLNDSVHVSGFDTDLSMLGEAIAKRVDLEDDLIETLNAKH